MSHFPKWKCRQYVEKHAVAAERFLLLNKPRDEALDDDFTNIVLNFDTMPNWLFHSNVLTLDVDDPRGAHQNEVHWQFLLGRYRIEMALYHRDVKKTLAQIKTFGTGRALLHELSSARFAVTIVPWHGNQMIPMHAKHHG
jgi:hypothetical protein